AAEGAQGGGVRSRFGEAWRPRLLHPDGGFASASDRWLAVGEGGGGGEAAASALARSEACRGEHDGRGGGVAKLHRACTWPLVPGGDDDDVRALLREGGARRPDAGT